MRASAPSLSDLGEARPNLTPMTDVVFLLLVFFLVTMKFKTLDMKIEALLPADRGLATDIKRTEERPKIVARLDRADSDRARVKLDGQVIGWSDAPETWTQLTARAVAARGRLVALGGDPADLDAEIDAAPAVETGHVIRAIDAFTAAELPSITFKGTPPVR